MTIQLGQTAPDFVQDSTQGPIHFHSWLGSDWGILFSHPKDFTPVCTTELGAVARLAPEWARRNTKVLGLSVDELKDHNAWEADIAETQGSTVDFPILADADKKVATLYGMIHPEADPKVTVRSVFIIDPNKKIRLTLTYPPSAGRSFDEILRVLDSLQLTDSQKVTTPAEWRAGEEVIIAPSVSDDEARKLFPQGWKALKPYLRLVKLSADHKTPSVP
ncbi:peroxiredoxin [Acetobacter tropicalis]|uniref:Alkyl hydroperoxide reductase C n=1 Tax=Acetobacter tropicalis TaxID=104102 RepID=A0A094YL90_9PROT|nr:peroxiredoxin [Acetobacter tropicalis]KAA8385646.1 peroxiredoxin [Acetobacter tropicalis]KAA8386725.1 peroxiredoxin [Acetobacter tropicalis]KGB22770.1 Alkyl hydroperoxide reductase subunit C-like protein [Acetobacter tropicalis]MBC9008214.1 peroxiredoxin [Acetobacter tropicalis]MDO8170791.1 peroxiredoxin [Acetobacter tropicalis]